MTTDRMILGENCVYSTDPAETGINNNVIVCGSSGCGKTLSISEPRLLETCHSSLITTVTKRRIVNKYKPVFLKRGYAVQDLDFVDPSRGNVGFDLLCCVKTDKDISFLAESIVNADPRKNRSNADPYWDESAISLLSAIIKYVMITQHECTFTDVLEMIDRLEFKDGSSQIETNYDKKFELLARRDPTNFAVTCWKSFRLLPIKTASCVFGVLNTAIDTIFSKELRETMSMENQVDIERLAMRRTVLFITTSPVNPSLHFFINMFYAQIFKRLFEFAENRPDGMLPVPVHVLCDDFATGGRILNFPDYISIFREKRLSVTLMLQSESQLESMYGADDATTIINNCDTYIYMGGMDLKTAQRISTRLDAPLDEVLYMPIGQELIFRRGARPIVTKRYDIFSNVLWQRITRQYEERIAREER
ncbi:MAG: type IV secretory system conjugative DNA transfer family protein [Lachnospiraceae bacterium]|nr:type IV secretory system conjugative DNA transfer family protein [Lachnospiraceae bacterium]